MRIVYWILLGLFVFPFVGARAEVIAVPSSHAADSPTLTMYFEGKDSKALLLLIPGGDGHINLKLKQTEIHHHFYLMLKKLSLGSGEKENLDVVLFDNPESLGESTKDYPSSRATTDHLSRIRDVIQFYKEKTHKPVWLMGHSNGAVSVTEYIRYEQRHELSKLLGGLILSSARKAAFFDSTPINYPVLFLEHEKDACIGVAVNVTRSNFKKVKELNTAKTEFVFLESGSSEDKHACASGFHMYHGADEEFLLKTRKFIFGAAN